MKFGAEIDEPWGKDRLHFKHRSLSVFIFSGAKSGGTASLI